MLVELAELVETGILEMQVVDKALLDSFGKWHKAVFVEYFWVIPAKLRTIFLIFQVVNKSSWISIFHPLWLTQW